MHSTGSNNGSNSGNAGGNGGSAAMSAQSPTAGGQMSPASHVLQGSLAPSPGAAYAQHAGSVYANAGLA